MVPLERTSRCSALSRNDSFLFSEIEVNSSFEVTSTQLRTSLLIQSCFQRVFDCSTLLSITSGNLLGVFTKATCLKGLTPIFQQRAWIAGGISSIAGCLMEATGIHFIPQLLQQKSFEESGLGRWTHLSLTIFLMKGVSHLPLSNPLIRHAIQGGLMTGLDRICGIAGLIETSPGGYLEEMIQAEVMSCQMMVGIQYTYYLVPGLKNLETSLRFKTKFHESISRNRKNSSMLSEKAKALIFPIKQQKFVTDSGFVGNDFHFFRPTKTTFLLPICEMRGEASHPPRRTRISSPLQSPDDKRSYPPTVSRVKSGALRSISGLSVASLDPNLLKLPFRSLELSARLENRAHKLQAYQFLIRHQQALLKASIALREGKIPTDNPSENLLEFMKREFVSDHHHHLTEMILAVKAEMQASALDTTYPKHPDWQNILWSFEVAQLRLKKMELLMAKIEKASGIEKILLDTFVALSGATNNQIAFFYADMYSNGPDLLEVIRDHYRKAHHTLKQAVFIQSFGV